VFIYTASRIERVGVLEDPLGGRLNPVKKKDPAAAKVDDDKDKKDAKEGDE